MFPLKNLAHKGLRFKGPDNVNCWCSHTHFEDRNIKIHYKFSNVGGSFVPWRKRFQVTDWIFFPGALLARSWDVVSFWPNSSKLTHWDHDKMATIVQTTFSNAFHWMKNVWTSINISLKFVPKGLINNIPALVQIMAWRRPGDKPVYEAMMKQWWLDYWCIYASLGLNELRHIYGSVLFK